MDRQRGGRAVAIGIRAFRLADLDEVLRLESASFPDEAYPRRAFLEWFRRSPELFLVATTDSRPDLLGGYLIAAVEAGPSEHGARMRGRIISIAIDPACRRQGIAEALSRENISRLESAGARFIDLETRLDNHGAIRLWKGLGFLPGGIISGYYHDGADALTMRRVSRQPQE